MELAITTRWEKITHWILDRCDKYPKNQRFIFGQRTANLTLDILELLLCAQFNKKRRREFLREANTKMDVLRVMLRIAWKRQLISARQYEYISKEVVEAGSMVGSWRKQAAD